MVHSFKQWVEKKEKELKEALRRFGELLSPREPIPKGLYLVLALSSFAFFLIIWSILTYGGFIDPLFLPSSRKGFSGRS